LTYKGKNKLYKQMAKDKMKIKIHLKKMPRKTDAMFYHDKHIATLTKGNRKIFVETSGEMKVAFSIDGQVYTGTELAKELINRGLGGANDLLHLEKMT
jgi:hypothetical protein